MCFCAQPCITEYGNRLLTLKVETFFYNYIFGKLGDELYPWKPSEQFVDYVSVFYTKNQMLVNSNLMNIHLPYLCLGDSFLSLLFP